MIFLILCILANILLAHIFKLFSRYEVDNLNAIIINYLMCVVTSSVVLQELSVPLDFLSRPWFGLALVISLLFITGFNIMGLSYQKAGVSLTVIIQKMSLIIPVAFAVGVYGEQLNGYQLIGILLAIGAIVLVNWPEKSGNASGLDLKSAVIVLPLVTMILSGVIEVLLFYAEASGRVTDDGAQFTATCFFMAGLFGLMFSTYRYFSQGIKFGKKELIGGIALGIPNYFSIYLLIFLLSKGWNGSVLFPMNNIGILLAGTALGIVVYRESVHKYKIAGLLLGALAITFIGFLGT